MMAALMDADPDQAAVISAPVLCSPAAVAMGHSYHMGPPRLRSSVPWGLQLLHEADVTHPALHAARDALEALQSCSEMVVSVDWDGVTLEQLPGVVELAVRRAGVQVAASEGRAGSPLSVSFSDHPSEALASESTRAPVTLRSLSSFRRRARCATSGSSATTARTGPRASGTWSFTTRSR